MKINADKKFDTVVEMVDRMFSAKPKDALMADAQAATKNMELELSLSEGQGSWSPPDPGVSQPFYVDQGVFGQNVYKGDDVRQLVGMAGDAKSPEESRSYLKQLSVSKKYNRDTGRFDLVWGRASDALVGDAAPDLIGAQLASPGSIGYFTDIFLKPLIWSNAMKNVEVYTGTNPWAEMMTLVTGDFSGFAALLAAGALSNNMSNDVEFQAGLMTQAVINASVTYRISVEELERSRNPNSTFPFNGQPITYKQQYANFVLDLMRDYVIYNGIPSAGITGLFTVNGMTSWPTSSLTTIANGASTTKGHDMYIGLAKQVASFLSASYNMFSRVRIGMSPAALNLFTTYNYSDNYNPDTALVIMVKNFLAGQGKNGVTPDIEIYSDPLLAAGTLFNPAATDILTITAPEIVGGPDNQNQALIRFGMPLPKFMYPVIPGMQGTPYKTLSRFGGVFAPYTPAVATYSGFGV
ncbi:hypothetical protein [Tetrasphaera phage TJE1]|uniref:Uncharacterized protein n=1 Tax=Tetrasphaera phage TJE1 TaxID=981335 RepID=G4W959_9CAUD|nr:hypothetical protein G185_gp27 [Tetrasphaera phage TJE1]ADX42547.1 hypothetical protein [Tetrasphaera phage TJE1]